MAYKYFKIDFIGEIMGFETRLKLTVENVRKVFFSQTTEHVKSNNHIGFG